jgi:hypothetical protein
VNMSMWPFGVWWRESTSGDPLLMLGHLMFVCNNTIIGYIMSYGDGMVLSRDIKTWQCTRHSLSHAKNQPSVHIYCVGTCIL